MESDRTTPTRGSSTDTAMADLDNDVDLMNSAAASPAKFMRKISFDDFELEGDVVLSIPGVLVQVQRLKRDFQNKDGKQGLFRIFPLVTGPPQLIKLVRLLGEKGRGSLKY